MRLALALLVALLPFQDAKESDAEALFRKVQEQDAGKSLRWKSTIAAVDPEAGFSVTTEAAFKDGNKARYSFAGKVQENEITFALTCDGAKLRLESSKLGNTDCDASKDYAAGLRDLLKRGGLHSLNHLPKEGVEGAKLRAMAEISALALAADEKVGERDAKVLTYNLESDGRKTDVKLWIDAKTLAPIKRELGSARQRMRETWTEWTIGPELADELFQIK